MKQSSFISILMALFAISANAQLKLTTDGNIYMHRISEDTLSDVSIGECSMLEDYKWYKKGLHVQKAISQSAVCYGIYSEALKKTNNWGDAVGVYGYGLGDGNNNRKFGVVGTIPIGARGAGVCGTEEGACPPHNSVYGNYAGYFLGETYFDGNVTGTTGIYNYSDIRLKDNVSSLKDAKSTALDNLQKLDVIEYNLKRPNKEIILLNKKGEDKRRHYGVSAQELQEVYPDLVRESQEGYLTVNYTELVPILIRSIQELKAELDEVKGTNGDVRKARAASFEEDEPLDVKDATSIPAMATLAQNTPNPFSERTTIRFTLPENAQNAFIYIFDMSGKMQKQIPVDSSMESVIIEGYELRAGMYIYSLVIGGKEIDTKRMILSK